MPRPGRGRDYTSSGCRGPSAGQIQLTPDPDQTPRGPTPCPGLPRRASLRTIDFCDPGPSDFAIPGPSSFALSIYLCLWLKILSHVTQLPPPTRVYTAHTFSRKRPTHAHSQSTSLSSLECSLIYSSRAASGDGPVLSRVYIHPLKATKKTNGGAAVCQTTKQGAG